MKKIWNIIKTPIKNWNIKLLSQKKTDALVRFENEICVLIWSHTRFNLHPNKCGLIYTNFSIVMITGLCGRNESFDRVRIDNDINHIEQKQPSITRQNVKIDKNRPKTVNITGFWLSTQVLRQTHYIWVTYRFYYKRMFFFWQKIIKFFFRVKKNICFQSNSTFVRVLRSYIDCNKNIH